MNQRIFWYWLNNIYGLKKEIIWKLIDYYQSPEMIYWESDQALRYTLSSYYNVSSEIINKVLNRPSIEALLTDMKKFADLGIKSYCPSDVGYIEALKHIYDAPCYLHYKGTLPKQNYPTIAIVGARACTDYGLYMAEYMGYHLAKAGVQIVSGLARGIDTAAHKGALKAKKEVGNQAGITVGILGTGIDVCYPKENLSIYYEMYQNGCVMTEYPLGLQPLGRNFPIRNRIISGLSQGILVIEAKKSSGSLITAHMGLEQGRDIYALPGRAVDPMSNGTNKLIQAGAKLVIEPSDILEDFNIEHMKMAVKNIDLSQFEAILYEQITFDSISIESLSEKLHMKVEEINLGLIKLEIKGLIRRLPNNTVVRCCN